MESFEILEELRSEARKNEALKKKILATEHSEHPLRDFCRIAAEEGYALTEMDVVEAGEEFHAAMKRSTNGGGENSPMLEHQDDFYAMLLGSLKNS